MPAFFSSEVKLSTRQTWGVYKLAGEIYMLTRSVPLLFSAAKRLTKGRITWVWSMGGMKWAWQMDNKAACCGRGQRVKLRKHAVESLHQSIPLC